MRIQVRLTPPFLRRRPRSRNHESTARYLPQSFQGTPTATGRPDHSGRSTDPFDPFFQQVASRVQELKTEKKTLPRAASAGLWLLPVTGVVETKPLLK